MSEFQSVRTVAIIPARGGSKGIPGKNGRLVGGVPLLSRTIRAAKAAASVDLVAVSSDDHGLLALAVAEGAVALHRPPEISGDQASSESALLHGLDVLQARGCSPERLVFLQCTSPFTRGEDVEALVAALDGDRFEAALLVSSSHGFIWRIDEAGEGFGVNHDNRQPRQRRQDRPKEYQENGAGYAMKVAAFRAVGSRFCGRTALVPTDLPVLELDEPEDLEICEALLNVRGRRAPEPARLAAVKLLVTDFDGVHTDDHVWVGDDGREHVRCSRSDGLGVGLLRSAGVETVILSKEVNPVVGLRGKKLKVEVLQGIDDKLTALKDLLQQRGLTLEEVAYLGNDVNDLPCLRAVGLPLAPSDAHMSLDSSIHRLKAAGGQGVIREACDLILKDR